MATFVFALVFLLLLTAAMAVGVIFANKPIKGSCGGIQALGLGQECDICGGDPLACEKENQTKPSQKVKAGRFYNAAD
ncbi:MAG: (Na+)-NQR maturation NqrM [Gammaproteobacteria bacterium]|nr:(Na+)-NQR maturation NqrM [Gammaproteobacteria bacterium]NND38764.1 (Na+)-NQR maturation NqrM [Pseudomonadales bacterium]MBT8149939.1 (Na+)-NQR maturation NqrM [Gammaproteobacteria bacterium]NNL10562.1 (Na+)-NQR maturation NqrM [Pseudomonadales bacterium]NNM10384.1 (Na+)-NQR maturation NqrM [Pseudomonadales bacterium]